jgi:transcriptional regulator with XRE-family HTH domain
MTLLERVKALCKEKGISQRRLESELKLGNGATSKWVKSSPSGDILQKIAEYFDVSIDWLLGNTEFRNLPNEQELANDVKRNEEFSKRDKRDIAKTMNFMLEQLDNFQDALMFDGEALDDETRELLKDSIENSIKIAKVVAKSKYNPNKNKM